ncbi:phage distal tail protein [Streptomyces lavendulae]|uniref:phage distal tail protein n=1 Tax=Streptomyces lavendulae TaxID=1914 RepID=UPI0036E5DB06
MPYTPGTDLGGRRADLGAVPLGGVDGAGVAWHLQTLDGWDGSEVRAEFQQREADHGAWASRVYLGERPITLAGKIEAPDLAALDEAMEQLRAAAALTDTLLVVYETVPKQAFVRRAGKPLIRELTDRIAEFSVLVTARDPRRYAAGIQSGTTGLPATTGGLVLPDTVPFTLSATTVAGAIPAPNVGTLATRPVLTIDGPVTQPQVLVQLPDGTVRALLYSQSLAAGDRLVIDTDAHSVTLNGTASRRRYLTTPQGWPELPAESTSTIQFQAAAYDAAAMLTAEWRSAWL